MDRFFVVVAFTLASAAAFAQHSPQSPGGAPPGHQIGLIDMAQVFKNYQKFTAMTESLQREIEQGDSHAKAMIEDLKRMEQQLTSGNLQEGSPDFVRLESQMLKVQTDLESYRRVSQRNFLKKEADIYKTVYLEVEDAVRRYAKYYNYTLILRFNRQRVDETESAREIINSMNRQVIFHRSQDDVTDPILNYLNDEWRKKQTAGGTPAPTR